MYLSPSYPQPTVEIKLKSELKKLTQENDEPCPITCNGDSPTAWSKTMIGTVTEDEGYALEVTYNYGVEKYPAGTGLTSFNVMVKNKK